MTIKDAVSEFVENRKEYYQQWIFDKPLLIAQDRVEAASTLQKLMHKIIVHFVSNYSKYKDLMPVSSKVEAIIDCFSHKTYNVGTYRTDFVFDENRKMKLIEITCRFALNGLFLAAVMEEKAQAYKAANLQGVETLDYYTDIFTYLDSSFNSSKKIFVLKGGDLRNASKIYTDILTRAGFEVVDIRFDALSDRVGEISKNDTVISELALEEIESLDLGIVEKLSGTHVLNDFRTVFLIHDKRFFSVISNDIFLRDVLNEQEISYWKEYTIPTYAYNKENMTVWEESKLSKDNWIIKHNTLGKSQKIFAGPVMSKQDWESVFVRDDIGNMILQKWVPQFTMRGRIDGLPYDDYVTGTLLYFDEHFFGFGDFRTSSHPVINVIDHRKYCSLLISSDGDRLSDNEYNIC